MRYPTEFNVRTAAKGYNPLDMQKSFVTSQDFGVMKPVECKLCFPGDKLRLQLTQSTKVLTMPAPTFGSAEMILRAFYVPINNIFSDFNEFISKQKSPSSINTLTDVSLPFLYAGDIASYFLTNNDLTTLRDSAKGADICEHEVFIDASQNPNTHELRKKYYSFTYKGRKLFDFFVSMGLKFPWYITSVYHTGEENEYLLGYGNNASIVSKLLVGTSSSTPQEKTVVRQSLEKISVLPLLAWWKFYVDWVVPSRYLSNYTDLRYLLRLQSYSSLSYLDLMKVISRLPVSFLEDDFFTTAFSTPYGYEDSNNISTVALHNDLDSLNKGDGVVTNLYYDNNMGASVDSTDHDFNMFSLRSLGALQDMVNRGKIAGSKIKDYLEVTYGIRASDDALHISTYLGKQIVPIEFTSMQNQSDTFDPNSGNGSVVGAYVGRGEVSNKPFDVKFDVKDKMHGFFFVTSELRVKTSYTQGLAPEFKALTPYDFFDPAFDGVGVDGVPHSLLCNMDYSLSEDVPDNADPNEVFGYVQRYAQYKVNFDNVSGDFIIPSLNTGLDSWYLNRMFHLGTLLEYYPSINEKFLQAVSDDTNGNYTRIFTLDNTAQDHFRTIFNVELNVDRKAKSLRDTLEFEDGGENISKSINNSIQS